MRWLMSLIPTLGRQGQGQGQVFVSSSLVYLHSKFHTSECYMVIPGLKKQSHKVTVLGQEILECIGS